MTSVVKKTWWQANLKWAPTHERPSSAGNEMGGKVNILHRGIIRGRRRWAVSTRDKGNPSTITRDGLPKLKGIQSHIKVILKHQITSFSNNGFNGEVHRRGKKLWHSSAICGAADEVLWFLAVFEDKVLRRSDGPLPPTLAFSAQWLRRAVNTADDQNLQTKRGRVSLWWILCLF